MSQRGAFLMGLLTVVAFLGAGGMLLADGNRAWGIGLLVLGTLRGVLLWQSRPRDDDD